MTPSNSPTDLPLEQWGRIGFAMALRMLGSRDDAADAVQDSLYQLLRKWHSFDAQKGEAKSWFLKIVRNRCIDTIRTRSRHKHAFTDLQEIAQEDQGAGPNVEQQEQIRHLKKQLNAMPDDSREILLLRDFHDLSYAEIAHILSIPAGTVMSRLHRSRQELRRRMEARR